MLWGRMGVRHRNDQHVHQTVIGAVRARGMLAGGADWQGRGLRQGRHHVVLAPKACTTLSLEAFAQYSRALGHREGCAELVRESQ